MGRDERSGDMVNLVLVAALMTLRPTDLRCECLSDPLGVDAQRPRLSWELTAVPGSIGKRQSAYRIVVSSAPSGTGDLWDSGKVLSGEQNQIEYRGKALRSDQACLWKVRAWDESGKAGPWSKPARWEMGLLRTADWRATWICAKTGQGLFGCKWIWLGDTGTVALRRGFLIPTRPAVKRAVVTVTADSGYRLWVNGKSVGEGADWHQLREFDVTKLVRSGQNAVAIEATHSGAGPGGMVARVWLEFEGVNPVDIPSSEAWHASTTPETDWQKADFDASKWVRAKVVAEFGDEPWKQVSLGGHMPIFRREFALSKPVRSARAYICGLGQFELRLNGKKVGDSELDPGWTNYRKTCLYRSFDVTRQLRAGPNALGVMLGNGMYNVVGGRYTKFTGSFGPPKIILQLDVTFADGTTQRIVTDQRWASAPGPITFSCTYGGEDFDARAEPPGWDRAGFRGEWTPAVVLDGPGGVLRPQTYEPMTIHRTFEPVAVTEPKPGVRVYDLGQNFSGFPEVTVRGPAGSSVTMTLAELLKNGLPDQGQSGGPATFTYTLKGGGLETWRPRFTYYGFRYVQVEANGCSVQKVVGRLVYPSVETTGSFSCSDPLLNRIHEIIHWAIVSNMKSVLTDCPHREKLGWLEESHLMGLPVMYGYGVPALYTKICRDMAEAQLANGLVPDIAPEYVEFQGGFRDSPEWGSAYVIDPWFMYQVYGDKRVLAEHYEGMKRYVAYLMGTAKNGIVSHGLGDWADVGPNPPFPQNTPVAVPATAITYYDITILERVARLLGKREDAKQFAALGRSVRDAFNKAFFHPDTKQYATGSQASNGMALALGLVDDANRAAVLENLVADVRAHGDHTSAGDVGHRFVLLALAEGGRSDVIFDMASQHGNPSYGYQIDHGATALTEAWDGPTRGWSQNHFMMGHIDEWFTRWLGGIREAAPGFAKVLIRPEPVAGLRWVKTRYRSIRGEIASEWSLSASQLRLTVTIPPNVSATVAVPVSSRPQTPPGARFVGMESGRAIFEVGSGTYTFRSRR